MFTFIAAVKAWLRAVWRWLLNAASTCWRRARPEAHYAWETFKERFLAAVRQAIAGCIDDVATAAKKAIAPTPQGGFPAFRQAIAGCIDVVATAAKEAIAPTPQGQFPAAL